jgi:LysR family transcriptional regulator, nod-box dependent transcriptional activator
MRFKGLDLNLLVAFDALIRCRSVTQAASRMAMSQPAMSAALARLRDYFGDEILITRGRRMYPTPYAEALVPQVQQALEAVEQLMATSASFDPATSQRRFRISVSDYIVAAIIGPLVGLMAKSAPHLRIEVFSPGANDDKQLEEGALDLAVKPEGYTNPSLPSELLFEESHVVIGWKGNRLFDRPLSQEAYLEAAHVQVTIASIDTPAFADRQLAAMGMRRNIEVVASSFTVVPWLLQGTQRLSLMHARLAKRMAEYLPILIAPVPIQIPAMKEMVQFHPAKARDDGLNWLRAQMRQVSTEAA